MCIFPLPLVTQHSLCPIQLEMTHLADQGRSTKLTGSTCRLCACHRLAAHSGLRTSCVWKQKDFVNTCLSHYDRTVTAHSCFPGCSAVKLSVPVQPVLDRGHEQGAEQHALSLLSTAVGPASVLLHKCMLPPLT